MRITKMALVGILALCSCGGSLSDDQRKKLREGMESQQITQVSDAEIVTAALEQGRSVFSALQQVKFDPSRSDSISTAFKVRLKWIVPGSSSALEVENQLIQAYIIGAETGSTQDNIQKLRMKPQAEEYDSLLYSRPIVKPLPDGSVNVEGVWNVYVSKKNVVLSLSR